LLHERKHYDGLLGCEKLMLQENSRMQRKVRELPGPQMRSPERNKASYAGEVLLRQLPRRQLLPRCDSPYGTHTAYI